MRILGLIGGLSPHSTVYYYRVIIEEGSRRLGRVPEFLIYNLDFDEFRAMDWDRRAEYLRRAARALVAAGAEILAVAANTPHKVIGAIRELGEVVDIRDAVAAEAEGLRRLLLLGTRTTMEDGFYSSYLENLGFEIIVPDEEDRRAIDEIIGRLTGGRILDEDREKLMEVIRRNEADAVILGCTELPLILQGKGMIDSARAHVKLILQKMKK